MKQIASIAALLFLFLFVGNEFAFAEGEVAEEASGPGMIGIIFSGGIVGICIIVFLLGLSITAAFLIFDHLMTIRRKDLMPEGVSDQVRKLLQSGKHADAESVCRQNPSLLSFVILHGISELEFGWSSVEKALEDAVAEQSARLYRKIEYLSVIGNIAPMVGLLGTVSGMIGAGSTGIWIAQDSFLSLANNGSSTVALHTCRRCLCGHVNGVSRHLIPPLTWRVAELPFLRSPRLVC